MKILIILTLYQISAGPSCSSDVIGSTGGSVIIRSALTWTSSKMKHFCKQQNNNCIHIINTDSENKSLHEGRFSLYENKRGKFVVLIRDLQPHDSAEYKFGLNGQEEEIDLKVNDCCRGPTMVNTILGQDVTLTCNYPEEFEKAANLFKMNHSSIFDEILNTGTEPKIVQNVRISEDRRSTVLSVRIRDVREDDEGVYSCMVWEEGESVSYHSLYKEIHLQVSVPGSSIIITTVCVCVILLLLIGGLILVFYFVKRKQRQGATPSSRAKIKDNKQAPTGVRNYEEMRRNGAEASSSTKSSRAINHSTTRPTKDQDPTYTTVSFLRNPALPTNTTVAFCMEESATEYASLRPHTGPHKEQL